MAADTLSTMQELCRVCRDGDAAVGTLNDRIVRQARKFVWATDKRQLRFIQNRLGEKVRWSSSE